MRVIRTPGRGSGSRLVFEETEFDTIAIDALRKVKLLPHSPGPVRIDDFAERYFEVTLDYQDLGDGVLGATAFRKNGAVHAIMVANRLAEDAALHLFRTTVAHEAGHGLLHPMLFMQAEGQAEFQVDNADLKKSRILCREQDIVAGQRRGYSGRWWEYQANRMIGSLLLPRPLVVQAMNPYLRYRAITKSPFMDERTRGSAVHALAAIFEVSRACADIRLQDIFPPEGGQTEF